MPASVDTGVDEGFCVKKLEIVGCLRLRDGDGAEDGEDWGAMTMGILAVPSASQKELGGSGFDALQSGGNTVMPLSIDAVLGA